MPSHLRDDACAELGDPFRAIFIKTQVVGLGIIAYEYNHG
jgi:hypothetical protein